MDKKLRLYGDPTPSDLLFIMNTEPLPFNTSYTLSSTRSDAESAPPELERVFERICDEYTEWVVKADKQLPPEWNMPDLVRAVIGDERLLTPGLLNNAYYDLLLHGPNSWLCQDLFQFLDLIGYNF